MKNSKQLPWQTEEEFYDLHASKVFKKDTFYQCNMVGGNEDENATYLIKLLNLKPNSKVLDLGCGSGYLVNKISEICDVIGISNSKECIAQAKKNYPNNKFIHANMESFTIENLTHCLCLEAIGYSNIERTFRTTYNNLVDGGIFFVKDTTLISNPNEQEKENINYWESYWKYYTYDVPNMISSGCRNGFKLIYFKEISDHPKLNMKPFMESLKDNIIVQDYPHKDISVQIPTEFIFQKKKREKWVNPYI